MSVAAGRSAVKSYHSMSAACHARPSPTLLNDPPNTTGPARLATAGSDSPAAIRVDFTVTAGPAPDCARILIRFVNLTTEHTRVVESTNDQRCQTTKDFACAEVAMIRTTQRHPHPPDKACLCRALGTPALPAAQCSARSLYELCYGCVL
jgi:hypothetical protein